MVVWNHQQGIALIVVLWMLVILTVIAFAFSQSVRTEVMLTSQYQNQTKALGLAEAGIWRGVAMVLNKSVAQQDTGRINLDGSLNELEDDNGEIKISLQSCSGLVDLNRAPAVLIKGLLQTVDVAAETVDIITDSLLDWRDEDDLKRLSGAELNDYISQGRSYSPKNGLINSTSELARINGVSASTHKDLKPFVTIYSGQPRIDITSAPKQVLLALPGMTDALVESIIAARSTGNKNVDLALIPAETRQYIGAGQDEFVRISSFAKVSNSVSGIIAVVKLEATKRLPVTIMSWRQDIDTVFME